MEMTVRAYCPADLSAMREIWNAVVEDGLYFPQTEPLSEQEAAAFFKEQSFCGVAEREGEVIGLYTIGRCGHIANASYAVKASARGNHVGGGAGAPLPRRRAGAGLSVSSSKTTWSKPIMARSICMRSWGLCRWARFPAASGKRTTGATGMRISSCSATRCRGFCTACTKPGENKKAAFRNFFAESCLFYFITMPSVNKGKYA